MRISREYKEGTLKVVCVLLPPVGTYFAIDDKLTAIVVGALEAVSVFFAVNFLSNITVPRAFALGYFSSFLDPIIYAADRGVGSLTYTKNGETFTQALPRDARLLVVLPRDLDVTGASTPQGIYEVLQDVQSKFVPAQLSVDPKDKAFGVYIDVSDPQRPQVVDVPNNLFALRNLVLRESGTEEQAKEVLKDYIAQLQNSLRQERSRLRGRVEAREVP
jgi:hypothetical protein